MPTNPIGFIGYSGMGVEDLHRSGARKLLESHRLCRIILGVNLPPSSKRLNNWDWTALIAPVSKTAFVACPSLFVQSWTAAELEERKRLYEAAFRKAQRMSEFLPDERVVFFPDAYDE